MSEALESYDRILRTCEPWIICRTAVRAGLDRAPLGIPIGEANLIDPQRVAHGRFLHLVQVLDEMTYGPVGLKMPSWVFYDCAVVPGALFGFARRAAELEPWVRQSLRVPADYDGLVPVSIVAAIPMAHRKAELVYTLCSVNQVAPGAAPEGLWRLTLAAGAAALGIDSMVATAQWRSAQLGLYAGFGPLALQTAWTPAHDIPETATFTVASDAAARQRLLRGELPLPERATRWLDADDRDAMRALQSEIEGGTPVWVVGPPEIRGAATRIPLQSGALDAPVAARDGAAWARKFHG
ncbi:MAG: hypothetical protein U1F43_20305 [Myxococcota bacterium]